MNVILGECTLSNYVEIWWGQDISISTFFIRINLWNIRLTAKVINVRASTYAFKEEDEGGKHNVQ